MRNKNSLPISSGSNQYTAHISVGNAMGGAQSTPSAVFSSETASPAASAAGGAAPAPTAEKPVEEDNSDNGYYDQLMAMLNKRR